MNGLEHGYEILCSGMSETDNGRQYVLSHLPPAVKSYSLSALWCANRKYLHFNFLAI